MRVGFLFNHDQIHQVAHSLPVAMALASVGDVDVVLASSSDKLTAEIRRIAGAQIGRAMTLTQLAIRSAGRRLAVKLLDRVLPAHKLLLYEDNLAFFRSLDVLVVTEKTSLILKTRYGLDALKIVHTRHGAGDRAVGFDASSAKFDHVLVSGEKIRDRLIADAGVAPARISIVGYPKFDLPAGPGFAPPAHDRRPVVLYNPHVSPHLSSWYEMGQAVLDWFVEHDDHCLIFAPHVMLFERRMSLSIDRLALRRTGFVRRRHLSADNIHIDLGSRASTTMAYTKRSDIYVGDVSSQVYEFLREPRPCLFLNAQRRAGWETDPNYAHWRAGPVIDDVAHFGKALAYAIESHASRYAGVQRELFDRTFDIDDTQLSSQRAARAIVAVAHDRMPSRRVRTDIRELAQVGR